MRGYPSADSEHMFDSTVRARAGTASVASGTAVSSVAPRPVEGRPWRAFEVALAAAAALPTIVGAALGSPLATDDWWYVAKSRYLDFLTGYGPDSQSRPLQGVWNWAEFRFLGAHAVPHLLVLAAVNVAAAILFWRLLARWLPRRIAVLTALAWVALPNRGSTHLWSTNSPNMFSVVMLLAALLVGSTRPLRRAPFALALTMLVLSALAYEGGLAIGVAGLVAEVWTGAARQVRLRWVATTLGVMVAVAISILLNSQKRNGPTPVFRNLSHLPSAHFGSGVLPPPSGLLAIVVLVAIVWCIVTVVMPGFEPLLEQKLVVVGLVVIALGALPFAVNGFPFSTSGFFDRGNAFSDLGTALVYGSLLSLLLRVRWRTLGVVLAGAGVIGLAIPNVRSVGDYVRAGRDGSRLLAAIDQLPVAVRTKGPVTFAPLPSPDAVAEFLYGYDISAALAVRYRTATPFPRAAMAPSFSAFRSAEGPKYELVGRHLVQRG